MLSLTKRSERAVLWKKNISVASWFSGSPSTLGSLLAMFDFESFGKAVYMHFLTMRANYSGWRILSVC